MKATMKIAALVAALGLITLGAEWPVPAVSNVTMTQIPLTRQVQITYDLADEEAIITLSIETNGVALPDSAVTRLTGDVCKKVAVGTGHTIRWNAGMDWSEHLVTNAKARVTAWVTNAPPQVMVIDLSKGTSATAQNPYPVFYYNSLDGLPNGGLSNDMYKTVMLVMNKIPSGGFDMGDESTDGASVAVTLSQAFYAGVYAVTQRQWYRVTGLDPSGGINPAGAVNTVSYNDIRGTSPQGGGGWPTYKSVDGGSFMGLLVSKTGLAGFDLPTEAQWEYACRAGTTTYYNDGIDGSDPSQLDDLGWWQGNSGASTPTVGQKKPNNWMLYDMHGLVREWCLDRHVSPLPGKNDPVGGLSGNAYLLRGGGYSSIASQCTSAFRSAAAPTISNRSTGVRLVRTLP